MYKHIMIPTDGSETGTRAVEQGLDLARVIGAKVTILTVLQPYYAFAVYPEAVSDTIAEHRRMTEEHVQADIRLEEKVRGSGVNCAHINVESNRLGDAVRRAAESEGCDLVVMPAHDRFGLFGNRPDSETVDFLSHSHMPVLVVH